MGGLQTFEWGSQFPDMVSSILPICGAAKVSLHQKYEGDFQTALGSITAKSIIMPGSTDLYFTVADSELEQQHMTNAELRTILSPLGHIAGPVWIQLEKQKLGEQLQNYSS